MDRRAGRLVIVVYHYARCSKSREATRLIGQAGYKPVLIDYAEAGWTRSHLIGLFAAANVTPREALRRTDAEKLTVDHAGLDDEGLLAAMVRHPILVERPFVCAPGGVRLCRPPEKVLEVIDPVGAVFDASGVPLTGPDGAMLA